MAYSGLLSVSARRWLRTATSLVVIPNLERISLSCSDGFWGSMPPECTATGRFGASARPTRCGASSKAWQNGGQRVATVSPAQGGGRVHAGLTPEEAFQASAARLQTARS